MNKGDGWISDDDPLTYAEMEETRTRVRAPSTPARAAAAPTAEFGAVHGVVLTSCLGVLSCYLPMVAAINAEGDARIPTIISSIDKLPFTLLVPSAFLAAAAIGFGLLRFAIKPRLGFLALQASCLMIPAALCTALWGTLSQITTISSSPVSVGPGVIIPALLGLGGAFLTLKLVFAEATV